MLVLILLKLVLLKLVLLKLVLLKLVLLIFYILQDCLYIQFLVCRYLYSNEIFQFLMFLETGSIIHKFHGT